MFEDDHNKLSVKDSYIISTDLINERFLIPALESQNKLKQNSLVFNQNGNIIGLGIKNSC